MDKTTIAKQLAIEAIQLLEKATELLKQSDERLIANLQSIEAKRVNNIVKIYLNH
jgi:hypothetical protein